MCELKWKKTGDGRRRLHLLFLLN